MDKRICFVFVMEYASHTGGYAGASPLMPMHQYFIVLTHLLYHLQRRQVAGEDEGWSCAGEHILDVLLEMQKERERKDEVAM